MKCKPLIFFVLLSLFNSMNGALPDPYDKIELLPFDDQSLYLNAEPIEALIKKNNVKIVVELGSWLGGSTRHIAMTLPPDGKVYAIDHWLGGIEEQKEEYLRKKIPTMYQQFLSNTVYAGLTEKIIPLRMTTLTAAKILQIHPDLIYLDASHDEESVYNDLVAWFPFVQGHGIMSGDDWSWGARLPIQKAVQRFANERHLKVHTNGWFWFLEE